MCVIELETFHKEVRESIGKSVFHTGSRAALQVHHHTVGLSCLKHLGKNTIAKALHRSCTNTSYKQT